MERKVNYLRSLNIDEIISLLEKNPEWRVISIFKNGEGYLDIFYERTKSDLNKKLYGCISKDGEEIDGKEFTIQSLSELIDIIKNNEEIHINYFEDEDDLDLWINKK